MNEHKQEIESTRVGGLGGSDAAMVLKVGRKGIESLSQSDLKRLAVMTGQIVYTPIPKNEAMQRGDEFEEYVGKYLFKEWESNPKIELKNNPYSFDIFAHADHYLDGYVVEDKCTNKTIFDAENDYEAQLQWYYMLGAKDVQLCHCESHLDFDKLTGKAVVYDHDTILYLQKGLQLIDEFIKYWVYVPMEEWCYDDLLPYEQDIINEYKENKRLAKIHEEKAKELHPEVLAILSKNNVKNITGGDFNVTYKPAYSRVNFDSKRFRSENKAIDLSAYTTTTEVEETIVFSQKHVV